MPITDAQMGYSPRRSRSRWVNTFRPRPNPLQGYLHTAVTHPQYVPTLVHHYPTAAEQAHAAAQQAHLDQIHRNIMRARTRTAYAQRGRAKTRLAYTTARLAAHRNRLALIAHQRGIVNRLMTGLGPYDPLTRTAQARLGRSEAFMRSRFGPNWQRTHAAAGGDLSRVHAQGMASVGTRSAGLDLSHLDPHPERHAAALHWLGDVARGALGAVQGLDPNPARHQAAFTTAARWATHPNQLVTGLANRGLSDANVQRYFRGPLATAGLGSIGPAAALIGAYKPAAHAFAASARDAVEFPTQTVALGAGLTSDIAHGRFGKAAHSLLDPYGQLVQHFGQTVYQHPLTSALMVYGAARGVSRGIGTAGRIAHAPFADVAPRASRAAYRAGERTSPFERPIVGHLIDETVYSRDPAVRALQVAHERGRIPGTEPFKARRKGSPVIEGRVISPDVIRRAVQGNRIGTRLGAMDFLEERGNVVTRAERAQTAAVVGEPMGGRGGIPGEPVPIRGRFNLRQRLRDRTTMHALADTNTLRLILEGKVRPPTPSHPARFMEDLLEYRRQLGREAVDLDRRKQAGEGAAADKLNINTDNREKLDAALADPKALRRVASDGFRIARERVAMLNRQREKGLVEQDYIQPQQLKAKYVTALRSHAGAREGERIPTALGHEERAMQEALRATEAEAGRVRGVRREAELRQARAVGVHTGRGSQAETRLLRENPRYRAAAEAYKIAGNRYRAARKADPALAMDRRRELDAAQEQFRRERTQALRGDAERQLHEQAARELSGEEPTTVIPPDAPVPHDNAAAARHFRQLAKQDREDAQAAARLPAEPRGHREKIAKMYADRAAFNEERAGRLDQIVRTEEQAAREVERANGKLARGTRGDVSAGLERISAEEDLGRARQAEATQRALVRERRKAAREFRREHRGEPRTEKPWMLDAEGQAIRNLARADELARQSGVDTSALAHVSQRPLEGPGGAWARKMRLEGEWAPLQSRAGTSFEQGGVDIAHHLVMDDAARKGSKLAVAEGSAAILEMFSFGDFRTPKEAGDFGKFLQTESYVGKDGAPAQRIRRWVPKLRVVDMADIRRTRAAIARRRGKLSIADANAIADQLLGHLGDLGKRPPQTGGRYALMLDDAFSRFEAHRDASARGGDPLHAMQRATSAFRRTVLLTSTRWLMGNMVEMFVRTVLFEGIGPRAWYTGRRLEKTAREIDPRRAMIERAGGRGLGATYGMLSRHTIRHPTETWNTAPLREAIDQIGRMWRAGDRNLILKNPLRAAWQAWGYIIRGMNTTLEAQGDIAIKGKLARRDFRDFHQSWLKAHWMGQAAYEDLARGMFNTPRQVRWAQEIDRIRGKYSRFGPGMRKLVQDYTPFLPWYINSVRFIYLTMPGRHPVKTAALAGMYNAQTDKLKAQGESILDPSGKKGFLLGAINGRPVARYMPWGIFAQDGGPLGNVQQLLLPQLNWTMPLSGHDWKLDVIKDSEGNTPNLFGRAALALNSAAESFVPTVAVARRVLEEGGTSAQTSTIFKPSTKQQPQGIPLGGHTGEGLRAGAFKAFNPFHAYAGSAGGGSGTGGGRGSALEQRAAKEVQAAQATAASKEQQQREQRAAKELAGQK